MDLSDLVQAAMKQQRVNQSGLARLLGISSAAVSKMARGDSRTTSHGMMVKLAELAGVELAGMQPLARSETVDEIARLTDQFTGYRLKWARQVLELAPRLTERQQEIMLDMMRELISEPTPAAEQVSDDEEFPEDEVGPRPLQPVRVGQPVDEAQEAPKRAAS